MPDSSLPCSTCRRRGHVARPTPPRAFRDLHFSCSGVGSAGRACLRASSTLPCRSAMVRQRGPAGPLEGLLFFRILEPERLCLGSSRACPGAVCCIRRPISAGAPQQAAVMYHSVARVPSFLQHSAVFLYVCLLVSCLALTRQVWRGHLLYGRGFRHLRVSIRLQCHRAAMQSIGKGTPGVVSVSIRFATLVISGEAVWAKG